MVVGIAITVAWIIKQGQDKQRAEAEKHQVQRPLGQVKASLQFGHFETVTPGEILDFSLGKSFLVFFCWPRNFVRCSDLRKWSHYMFRAVR